MGFAVRRHCAGGYRLRGSAGGLDGRTINRLRHQLDDVATHPPWLRLAWIRPPPGQIDALFFGLALVVGVVVVAHLALCPLELDAPAKQIGVGARFAVHAAGTGAHLLHLISLLRFGGDAVVKAGPRGGAGAVLQRAGKGVSGAAITGEREEAQEDQANRVRQAEPRLQRRADR